VLKLKTKKILELIDSNDDNDQIEDIKNLIKRSSYDFDREFDFDNIIGPGIKL